MAESGSRSRSSSFLGVTVSGSAWLLRGQAAWLEGHGYDVTVLSPPGQEVDELCQIDGCRHHPVVISRQISPFRDLLTLVRLWWLFLRVRPDVVNVGTPKMGLLGIIAARMAGVPRCIYTCRGLRYEHEGGTVRRLLIATEKISGRFAHKVVCVGPALREQALADGVFRKDKAVVIGQGSSNGINLARFSPEAVDIERRKELVATYDLEGRFVFGFVGRLIDRKGINELVGAFERLHATDPDSILLLVGADDPSQLSDPAILARIEAHPAIHRTGLYRDPATAMSVMDVFVCPSWWEGFGNVFLEAAAMGLPIVGSQGTGCRDAVQDGFNGTCVPIKDEDTLLEAMRRYREDPELRRRHGENGPAWARNFAPERIWAGLEELYAA